MKRLFAAVDRHIYLIAGLISIILSFCINAQEIVINPDAICYLLSSQMVGAQGVRAAMNLCGQAQWPFYSVLVYYFSAFTHVSLATAAHTLDGFFTLISVFTFIAIIKTLGGSRRVMWFAALVILSAHEFNTIRQYIVRDHGYWAFYLLSVYFLLQYYFNHKLKNALLWSTSLLFAALFRLEGVIFLLLVPMGIAFWPKETMRNRVRAFFSLNLLLSSIVVIAIIFLLLHPHQSVEKLGRLPELLTEFRYGFQVMLAQYQASKAALAQYVLTSDGERDAGLVLALTLIISYLINVINNLSWIYSLLVAYAWKSNVGKYIRENRVIIIYLTINLLITIIFYAQHLFLSKRYLIALSLMLMMYVPFALEKLRQKRVWFGVAILFILLSFIGSVVDFGYSKLYMRQAGDWLAIHVPANARLYVNDYQVMYYSQHFGNDIFKSIQTYNVKNAIVDGRWRQYDYIAVRAGKAGLPQENIFKQESHLQPVQVFQNKRGDRISIYQIQHGVK